MAGPGTTGDGIDGGLGGPDWRQNIRHRAPPPRSTFVRVRSVIGIDISPQSPTPKDVICQGAKPGGWLRARTPVMTNVA
jgi:hypothetical protein